MPVIQLTDGSTRTYPQAVTAAQVAADISPRLLKQALAAQLVGKCGYFHLLTE